MNNQIIISIKNRMNDISANALSAEVLRNTVKEELQFYVLNFIYHHPSYSKWTMYGGSALRICHGLDRLSVDLDFEVPHAVSDEFLRRLKAETAAYFKNTYGAEEDILTIKVINGRGLLLRFHIGDKLSMGGSSKQIHVKIDINHFAAAGSITERIPINRDRFSFVIKTYNLSALMASKVAAIFLRGSRGVGKEFYGEKGRDIYDLLWYMKKNIIPDVNYLNAKGIDAKNPREIFDKLTLRMNKVNDTNLRQDLTPLFMDRLFIENWLKNWRESYMRLLDTYKIHTVTSLAGVAIRINPLSDTLSFNYQYNTGDDKTVRFIFRVSGEFVDDVELPATATAEINDLIDWGDIAPNDKHSRRNNLLKYINVFYPKIENYLDKTNRVLCVSVVETKLIRQTAVNLNLRDQILLNKSSLLSCELTDLMK
jgi:predicted nucleotidyltransferase component of viral defense system